MVYTIIIDYLFIDHSFKISNCIKIMHNIQQTGGLLFCACVLLEDCLFGLAVTFFLKCLLIFYNQNALLDKNREQTDSRLWTENRLNVPICLFSS